MSETCSAPCLTHTAQGYGVAYCEFGHGHVRKDHCAAMGAGGILIWTYCEKPPTSDLEPLWSRNRCQAHLSTPRELHCLAIDDKGDMTITLNEGLHSRSFQCQLPEGHKESAHTRRGYIE